MTKQEFVNVVANATGNSKTNVAVILDSILDTLKKEVIDGSPVTFRGFGKFFAFESKPRKARDFKNSKTIDVPAKTKFKFKAF